MKIDTKNLVLVQVVSADSAALLTSISGLSISIWNVSRLDYFTLRFRIRESDLSLLDMLVKRSGGELTVLQTGRTKALLRRVLTRPVLLLGILFFLFATLWAPTRIFFFRIDGNERISERAIIEALEACGVSFGTLTREIRSESVKNQLLETLPQLKWAGINTRGCLAVISIKERDEQGRQGEKISIVSSIVAARDGIIESCTVTSGTRICKVGQAVTAGQLLVSGYTDCGATILAGPSEAEIYALTKRKIDVVIPTDYTRKGEKRESVQKISLIFGKKRINFYNSSGISDVSCDKMYSDYTLTLPGGFSLPVVLRVEKISYYPDEPVSIEVIDVAQTAHAAAQDYLTQDMISGTIIKSTVSEQYDSGILLLTGEYRCREMIGRLKNEGNWIYNGEND